jgi:hypothetical protein
MLGKLLRIVGIIFMGLTAAFTLLGGAGTTCVALAAEKYPSMAGIAPYKWLYVIFVLVTLAVGVMGVRAVVMLIRGTAGAYRYSLLTLISGVVVGLIHIFVSRALRGKSMPVDAVVYTTLLTLAIFLLFRLPGLWEKVNLGPSNRSDLTGGGLAAIMTGASVLTAHLWAGPTHTFNGINYADVWHLPLSVLGWGLVLAGLGMAVWAQFPASGGAPAGVGLKAAARSGWR